MTPVHTLQRRFRELGRIRMGQQVASSGGRGKRPTALKQWRLTSYGEVGHRLLTQAAALYGGEPRPWQEAPQPGGWELLTASESLAFVMPPVERPFEVWLEKWTAAGCERRCDGERAQIYGGRKVGWRTGPCRCTDPTDPLKRECAIVFRFSVILPEVEGLGVWRVQTSSYHGAEELQGALAVLGERAAAGLIVPAHLRIEPREIKRPSVGPDGSTKTEVSKFVVPVIDFELSVRQLLAGEGVERLALTTGAARTPEGRPALPAGRPELPTTPLRVDETPPPAADDEPAEVLEPDDVEDPPTAGRLSAEERRDAIDAWTGLGFTAEEIKVVMDEVAGTSSTAELTDTQRWEIEGKLRALAAERKSS